LNDPVSIVIPNWNGAHLLRSNLPSVLAAAERYQPGAEVVVVDDGSTDESIQVLGSEFPGVRVVAHAENRGFGAACWTGVTSTRRSVVILLNSDVQVEADFIPPLVQKFGSEETFAAMPLIFGPGSHEVDTCVTFTLPYLKRGRIKYLRGQWSTLLRPAAGGLPWYTFYPCGAAVAIDRARFVDLGGCDPLFKPFYYEDIDFGFRAWRRGWTCQIVPESRVHHQGSQTIGKNFPKRRVQLLRKRNRILLHAKNFTSGKLLLGFLLRQGLRALLGLLRLRFIDLGATLMALPRLPLALRKRRQELRARLRSEEEVCAVLQSHYDETKHYLEQVEDPAMIAMASGESEAQQARSPVMLESQPGNLVAPRRSKQRRASGS
jgi:GT2 family glycosyltransferase